MEWDEPHAPIFDPEEFKTCLEREIQSWVMHAYGINYDLNLLSKFPSVFENISNTFRNLVNNAPAAVIDAQVIILNEKYMLCNTDTMLMCCDLGQPQCTQRATK